MMGLLGVEVLVVGKLETNCYLVWEKKSRLGWVIDPGDDGDYIQRLVADKQIKLTKIIATHGHFDHIMASLELQLAYKILFLVSKKDEFLVRDLVNRARCWLGVDSPPPAKISGRLKDGQRLKLGEVEFNVMETPGHTPGSVSLYCEKEKMVWVGDLMFSEGGVGRTDYSYGSELELKKSIKKILGLPAETMVYSGHGEKFKLRDFVS